MANFCEKCGANIDEVAQGMGLDSRIGEKFLQPGPGYGGSCFPKDTLALAQMGEQCGVRMNLVETAIIYNDLRKVEMAQRIVKAVKDVKNPRVAILGLTFKGGTDDVRESPAMEIVYELLRNKMGLKVFDPKGMENARIILKDAVYYAESIEDAAAGTDAIAILTEWEEFKKLNLKQLKNIMKTAKIIDLRNILNREEVKLAGFEYERIG